MLDKYIIIDVINNDYMKDDNNNIICYDTFEEASNVCGIYEFENVWICKLMFNHKENGN